MKKLKLKRWMPLSPAIIAVAIAVVILVVVYALIVRETYLKHFVVSSGQDTHRMYSELTERM